MATCTRTVWKALAGCQRQLLSARAATAARSVPVRTAARIRRKDKKEDAEKEEQKEKRVVDDAGRHKPYGKTAWTPVDDVHVLRFYPRTVHGAADAVGLLKRFQQLDFTPRSQPVYVDLKLDMKLEKKKRVDPFVSTVTFPHPIKTEMNRVLVFTEDADQVKVAQESGAVLAGGAELIQPILDGAISADFYVAVPTILSKLQPLKSKLRKKFPKSKRGTVDVNIPKMLELFKKGHEYMVENDCFVRTQIALLDMPVHHILENLRTLLTDVCSHRPADMGPFIERAIVTSQTSEALWFSSEEFLPKPPAEEE